MKGTQDVGSFSACVWQPDKHGAFEATLHQAFREGHMRGEWFFDREIISLFLHDVTSGMPFCRTAWEIVETKSIFSEWDDQKKRHVTHRFDPGTARWELVA